MSDGTRDHWDAISRILDEALDLSPAQRVVWLSTLDTAHPGHAEEIRLLLQDHDALKNCGFLDSVNAQALAEACQPLLGQRPGATIGQYRLLRELGSGGMGVVWLGQQDHPIRRLVAVKVLKPGVHSADAGSRFELERQALAVLNHPGIAKVFEAGTTDEGQPYFVMEYLAGLPITEFCDQHRLPVSDRLRLFLEVCDAVHHAHHRGLIHRDLKPRNILVCQEDDERAVKIIDFGIAKSTGGQLTPESPQTQFGMIVGTPEYMSPEQAGVVQAPVDRRSDVYSLGVVLYELLAGALPFDSSQLRRHTVVEALRIIRDQEAVPLSRAVSLQPDARLEQVASLRGTDRLTLARQLRGDLEWIIARAISKAPAERYSSVADLRSEVRRHLEGQAVLAGPPSVRHRIGKIGRRYRRHATAAGVISLAIASSVVASTLYFGQSSPEERSASPDVHSEGTSGAGATPAMPMPQPLTSFTGIEAEPAWSPDGQRIAFIWNGERQDNFDIYVLDPDQRRPVRLTTEVGMDLNPAWSPDGQWIAYNRPATRDSDPSIELISSAGGARRTLLAHSAPLGAAEWSSDGRSIIFEMVRSSERISDLWVMSIDTLQRRRITSAPDGIVGDISPALSPDGRTLAFCRRSAWRRSELYLLELSADLTPVGEPRRVTELGTVDRPAWTPDGTRVVFESDAHGAGLWQLDRGTGRVSPVLGTPKTATQPAMARRPDGSTSLVFTDQLAVSRIWRYPNASQPMTTAPVELVPSSRNQEFPDFSRDGTRIGFSSTRSGSSEIWVADASGGNEVQLTNLRQGHTAMGHWSPDDRSIAFVSHGRRLRQIYIVNASGGAPTPVTHDDGVEYGSGWSRDGNAYYYTRSATSRREVWRVTRPAWKPEQVTFTGGEAGFESGLGTFYFWLPEPGTPVLKRRRGQLDERVDIVPAADPRSLAVPAPAGFYYKAYGSAAVYLYDESTNASLRVFQLPHIYIRFAVSPDGRWLAAGIKDKPVLDLMIVEQFR